MRTMAIEKLTGLLGRSSPDAKAVEGGGLRLIVLPGSLCAQLMKAKYFPNGDLLDTAFPTQVSPTWKAIMHGLDLLKKGAIWRVGSGTQIKIWRHSWLPRGFTLKPVGKCSENGLSCHISIYCFGD
jgi:hypothetical protein